MREIRLRKITNLLLIERDGFQFATIDRKASKADITFRNCDYDIQGDLKILFYFYDEDEKRSFADFIESFTAYGIHRDENAQYLYIDVSDLFDDKRKLSIETDMNFTNVEGENELEAAGIQFSDPKLISVCFDRNDWKLADAKQMLLDFGFATKCKIEGKPKKGHQNEGDYYVWYQNDPANYEDGLNPPKNLDEFKAVYIERKKVFFRFGRLKQIKKNSRQSPVTGRRF